MDKRYQVFVSSTYTDLIKERQKVLQTLMEMDCIPSGMELFPATDQQQWEFIQTIIDDCDYYLLIIGGRYGSTTDEGFSYTEKEYDYAVEKDIKIIAFLHEQPEELSRSKADIDPKLIDKLEAFKTKVKKNRLVKFWTDTNEIPGLVALSLITTIKRFPAVGWVRANTISSNESLSEINELRKENSLLMGKLERVNKSQATTNPPKLANLDSKFIINIARYDSQNKKYLIEKSWKEILTTFSQIIFNPISEYHVRQSIIEKCSAELSEKIKDGKSSLIIIESNFTKIKLQFYALEFIEFKDLYDEDCGEHYSAWAITEKGKRAILDLIAIKDDE